MDRSAQKRSCMVWYASYGSNIKHSRFMRYIHGGTAVGSATHHPGARDQTPPAKSLAITIHKQLFFSGFSCNWNGAPCMIKIDDEEETVVQDSFFSVVEGVPETPLSAADVPVQSSLGRMYLITQEQFEDVVSQENDDVPVTIDFDDIVANRRFQRRLLPSMYGILVYLGNHEDRPVLTFSATYKEKGLASPSMSYIRMLCSGYKELYGMKERHSVDYLFEKPGFQRLWTEKEAVLRLLEEEDIQLKHIDADENE